MAVVVHLVGGRRVICWRSPITVRNGFLTVISLAFSPSLLVCHVIFHATFYVFFHSLAGEGGTGYAINGRFGCLGCFHAVPFLEQSLLHLIEEVGSFLIGEGFYLYDFPSLDLDVEGSVATKAFYVLGKSGGVDYVSAIRQFGHHLVVGVNCLGNHAACYTCC